MFKFKNALGLIIDLQNENKSLEANILKQQSDMDYIAMMADIELEQEGANSEQI